VTLRRCYSGGVLQITCSLQYGVEKLLRKDLHLSNSFFLKGKAILKKKQGKLVPSLAFITHT